MFCVRQYAVKTNMICVQNVNKHIAVIVKMYIVFLINGEICVVTD